MADLLGKVTDYLFNFINSVRKIFDKDAADIERNPEIEFNLSEWWTIITTK